MAGDWDADDLTAVMEVFAARVGTLVPEPLQKLRALYLPRQPRKERNTEQNTRSNISRHYDLSNELFATFLDETMTYSSALFPEIRRGAEERRLGRLRRRAAGQDRPAAGQGRRRTGHPGAGDRHRLGRARPPRRPARRHRLLRHPLQRAAGAGPQARRRGRLRRRRHDRAQGLPRGGRRVRRRRLRRDDRGRGLRVLGHLLPDDRTGPGPRREGGHPGHHHRPRPAAGHPLQLHLGAQVHLPRRRHPLRAGHRGHHREADRAARPRTPRHGRALRPDPAALGGALHGPRRRRPGTGLRRDLPAHVAVLPLLLPRRLRDRLPRRAADCAGPPGQQARPPTEPPHDARRSRTPIEEVLRPLVGGELPVRLVVWDGTEAGPAGAPGGRG